MWTSRCSAPPPIAGCTSLEARYYDGKTALAQQVTLTREQENLLLKNAQLELCWPLQQIRISERLGNTPRLLSFAMGGHCEVSDHAALDALLKVRRTSWLAALQHSLAGALLAAALIVLSLLGAYHFVLPWGAEALAMRLPDKVLQQMGESTLEALDRLMLQPSTLSALRQRELSEVYQRLAPLPGARLEYRILFRSAPNQGANAFALPDGTLVLLDKLVETGADPFELAAVLAHERGHIERRHALRLLLQGSITGLLLAWYVGDVSQLLAYAPAIVMQAKYSRDMEIEADLYAANTLKHNALSPCLLASALNKLEAAQPSHPSATVQPLPEYLSSHPDSAARAAVLCPKN